MTDGLPPDATAQHIWALHRQRPKRTPDSDSDSIEKPSPPPSPTNSRSVAEPFATHDVAEKSEKHSSDKHRRTSGSSSQEKPTVSGEAEKSEKHQHKDKSKRGSGSDEKTKVPSATKDMLIALGSGSSTAPRLTEAVPLPDGNGKKPHEKDVKHSEAKAKKEGRKDGKKENKDALPKLTSMKGRTIFDEQSARQEGQKIPKAPAAIAIAAEAEQAANSSLSRSGSRSSLS